MAVYQQREMYCPCLANKELAGRLEAWLPIPRFAKLLRALHAASSCISLGGQIGRGHCTSRLDLHGKGGKVLSTPPAPGPEERQDQQCLLSDHQASPPAPCQRASGFGAVSLMERLGLMKEIRRRSVKRQANLDQTAGNPLSGSAEEPRCGKLWSCRRSSKTNTELPSGAGWLTGRMGESRGSGQAKL